MKVSLIVRRMEVSEQSDWCAGLGLIDVVKEMKQPEKSWVRSNFQGTWVVGADLTHHRGTSPNHHLLSCVFETTQWCSRCIANGYREGKPLLVYLLSNDIGVMVGLDLERAVVGPEVDGRRNASNASLINL